MHRPRSVAAATLLMSIGSLVVPTAAHATSATTFYVNDGAGVACSDTTTDSSVTPYCAIQAAVDVATSPGDTVVVAAGTYTPFSVTASGTASAPITIEGPNTGSTVSGGSGPLVAAVAATASTNTTPAVEVSGASYVTVENFTVSAADNAPAVSIAGSTHITFDRSTVQQVSVPTANPSVSIGSGSSDVTISRNHISASESDGAILAEGGSGDVITTNSIVVSLRAPAVTLNQTTGSDVTANSIANSCGQAVAVTNGSTSTSIQNNMLRAVTGTATTACDVSGTAASTLLVDSTSSAGSVADYNNVFNPTGVSSTGASLYSWDGVAYTSQSAFSSPTATGQGAHDLDNGAGTLADDANSDAPGELPTDSVGNPRVDNPNVPNTGAGTYSYYDRGATEGEGVISVTKAANWPTEMPYAAAGTFTAAVSDSWSNSSISGCVYDFGDNTAVTAVAQTGGNCTTQHTYGAVGTYIVKLTVKSSDGYSVTTTSKVSVSSGGQLLPGLTVSVGGARTVLLANSGYNGWNLVTCTFDFGDGNQQTVAGDSCGSTSNYSHYYQNVGTYTVTVTATDSDGQVATATGKFTATGDYYTPLTSPVRVLDTRHAIGVAKVAKVAAGATVQLKLAGADSVPSDAAAVVLNVTETDNTGSGFVTVYPGLTSVPKASNLNFAAGQTIANTVVVKLGTDGTVDLHNSGSGSIDLIADLEGYYAVNGSSYLPEPPFRLLDTRKTHTTLKPGGKLTVNLDTGIPGTTAATLNVTVTNGTKNGNITAFADDVSEPYASNLNYGPGQTVANEAVVRVGADGSVEFQNNSSGTVDLIVDFTGMFASDPTRGYAYVPLSPVRVLDTRQPPADLFVGGKLFSGALPAHTVGDLELVGAPPLGALAIPRAIAANVTATQPTANGFVVAYPNDLGSLSNSSTVNFVRGETIANATTVPLGQIGVTGIDLYNGGGGSVQLVVDVDGYYA